MKITNSAKSERFSEKHLTVEKLNTGDYRVTALEGWFVQGGKRERNIEMTFTPSQFAAVVGSWMAIEHGGKK